MRIMLLFFAGSLILATHSSSGQTLELPASERTAKKYREFQELIKDANQRANVAKILIAAAPFKSLLSEKVTPGTALKIAATDWELHARAMQGIDALARKELRDFAGLEAISEQNTAKEKRFWEKVYEQLGAKPEPVRPRDKPSKK